MAMHDQEARLIDDCEEGLRQRNPEPHVLLTDVRSTVESHFQQMEQTHARIRADELGARLAGHSSD